MTEHKSHVIKLFKDAGLKDSTIQFAEPLGLSHIASGNALVFEQFPNNREDVFVKTKGYFHQAIGVYRSRALEVFSVFYWIESIIYLPIHIFNYLGVSPESQFTKIFQLFWWFGAAVISIFYALYSPEINILLREWISKMIS